jgi:hypothetical protein
VAFRAEALFADRPKGERPLIESDSFSNSLTVVARPADLLDIENVILKLDETARDTSLQVRMIPLRDIPVERMATMLTNLYSQLNEGQLRLVDRLPKPPPRPSTSLTSPTNAPAVSRPAASEPAQEPPAGRAGGPSPAAPGAPGTARPTLEGRFMAAEQVQTEQGTSHEPSPKSGGEPPHSRRFATAEARPFRAQRMECVRFTGAFRFMAGEQVRKEQGTPSRNRRPLTSRSATRRLESRRCRAWSLCMVARPGELPLTTPRLRPTNHP